MGVEALRTIREAVLKQGILPVQLKVEHRVVYSTLQGNMPVNDRIHGSILDVPVYLRLEYATMPNISGTYPINNRFEGMIGDTPLHGKMTYKMVFSTLTGNFPVNTGIDLVLEGRSYHLDMPIGRALGRARGGGRGNAGGSSGGVRRVTDTKYVKGKMIEVDYSRGGGEGISYEIHRPIWGGVKGVLEDIQVDLQFSYTYYTNTSSGRNPISNRLCGVLRSAA